MARRKYITVGVTPKDEENADIVLSYLKRESFAGMNASRSDAVRFALAEAAKVVRNLDVKAERKR